MKKIVCLLVSYVILGLGVAFAQEITSLQYFKVNAERKSKVDDNTAKMQSIKWLSV